jgi:hypothetical protein
MIPPLKGEVFSSMIGVKRYSVGLAAGEGVDRSVAAWRRMPVGSTGDNIALEISTIMLENVARNSIMMRARVERSQSA